MKEITVYQTAMKEMDIGGGRWRICARLSFRSATWSHGSMWIPWRTALTLLNDLEAQGYKVVTTKRFVEWVAVASAP